MENNPEQGLNPTILAERDGYRVVVKHRNPTTWPNFADLTLEERRTDTMGQSAWYYVSSWMLAPRDRVSNEEDKTVLTFLLLLTQFPLFVKK